MTTRIIIAILSLATCVAFAVPPTGTVYHAVFVDATGTLVGAGTNLVAANGLAGTGSVVAVSQMAASGLATGVAAQAAADLAMATGQAARVVADAAMSTGVAAQASATAAMSTGSSAQAAADAAMATGMVAVGWGNHALAGYVTGPVVRVESDPTTTNLLPLSGGTLTGVLRFAPSGIITNVLKIYAQTGAQRIEDAAGLWALWDNAGGSFSYGWGSIRVNGDEIYDHDTRQFLGDGSALTNLTAAQVGALSTNGVTWLTNVFITAIYTNESGAVTGTTSQTIIHLGAP